MTRFICRNDFATYAETCFQKFGDRLKNWITFNEPHTFSIQGYDVGMDDPNKPFIPIEVALKNQKRIKYHNDYLTNLLAAIKEEGSNVKGYFVWSLLDNWEWVAGYKVWSVFCGFQGQIEEIPQGLCSMVQEFPDFLIK